MRVMEYLDSLPRVAQLAVGVVLVVAIGSLDYVTGPELSFSIFYLFPVSLIAWISGRNFGLLMSFFSAGVWLAIELIMGPQYSFPAVYYWNAAVRLGFFVVVTLILTALRDSRRRQEELGHFVVHDLQSPLANLVSGIKTLDIETGKILGSSGKDLINLCLANCEQLSILVGSLLDLARLELGEMPLDQRTMKVKELVDSSLEQIKVLADRSKVHVVIDVAENVDSVYADVLLTRRVLVNLLSNALKFSQPKSFVVVRATRENSSMVELSVTDQGSGIAEEWTSKVFDKFSQIDARKSGSAVGSGLGLTFCRKAIEIQGGRIWLRSIVNEGTTVAFTLPCELINVGG